MLYLANDIKVKTPKKSKLPDRRALSFKCLINNVIQLYIRNILFPCAASEKQKAIQSFCYLFFAYTTYSS